LKASTTTKIDRPAKIAIRDPDAIARILGAIGRRPRAPPC
jgi:hypothetical protein